MKHFTHTQLDELLRALDEANAQVRRAAVDTLASAPEIMKLAETDPEAAQSRIDALDAASTALLENSAGKIEPLAQHFLGESRKPGESPVDFMKRISERIMNLHPAAFNDRAAELQSMAREAKQRSGAIDDRNPT
jgi:hypothetical protein